MSHYNDIPKPEVPRVKATYYRPHIVDGKLVYEEQIVVYNIGAMNAAEVKRMEKYWKEVGAKCEYI